MTRSYELICRLVQVFNVPISWVFGSHGELVELVESGRIPPGRAIDLGCGTGRDAIFLSKHGFDVTGVDISPTAIKLARDNAQAAGVEVTFIEDDLTNLRHVSGSFDLLVDFGALNDLAQKERDSYVHNVLPLTHPGSRYLLLCFEKKLTSDEVERRFGEYFSIETIARNSESVFSRGIAVHLMTRRQFGSKA
jgi:cyclopropane fatty-acyl-phospholipid synthase-like methyltransferase